MVFNTLSVATAVTPSVIDTYFSHFLHRAPLRQKPTAHISYHEGLRLIRQFLDYSSKHTVEDLQGFTAQWVPAPTWVRVQDCEIAPQFLERAADILYAQLGPRGLEKIGGKTWWQWRRPESPLRAEWIEMKKDFHERRRTGGKCERVILYIHGGAYYFGSVDEHRYQMQRHARKMKARVLAPRYRLAPQFPFPCGLYDCIATYLYLLEHFPPSQILFAGDSAGGGMVLSLLVTLRDRGLPLPAGTILLSPWVDLTHSFPSVAGDGDGDYIPPHGFLHKPSMAWPPPPTEKNRYPPPSSQPPLQQAPLPEAIELPTPDYETRSLRDRMKGKRSTSDLKKLHDDRAENPETLPSTPSPIPTMGQNLSINLDNQITEILEQIQLYTPNDLLAHPLVSPVMQPTLGGLPPMLIQVGSAELLRDEQVYLAHKAADPKEYLPSEAVMREFDPRGEQLRKYPPTDVQLQVWEDLCHVPHTLSFTRPAKYAYRSVAQFGAWALAHAQQRAIDIQNDDAVSIISSDEGSADEASPSSPGPGQRKKANSITMDQHIALGAVGKAGDPLPPFKDHMIRQRVTRHGILYPLALPSEIACLHLDPVSIGAIKPGPVRKWLAARKSHDQKFANDIKKVLKKKTKEQGQGYDTIPGENPPPSALVNRRRTGVAPEEKKKGKSWGLAMWSGWGSHHDETTLDREEKMESDSRTPSAVETKVQPTPENAAPSNINGIPDAAAKKKRRTSSASMLSAPWSRAEKDRARSPYRQVTDAGQTGSRPGSSVRSTRRSSMAHSAFASQGESATDSPISPVDPADRSIPLASTVAPDSTYIPGSENSYLNPHTQRPHNGVSAYPFKLRNPSTSNNLSTLTLDSQVGGEDGNNFGPVELPTPLDTTPEKKAEYIGFGTPGDDQSKPVPFQRGPVFNNRMSLLGGIGPDGMPTAAPLARKNPPVENIDLPDNVEGTTTAPAELAGQVESSDPSAVPFKVRNPVFDPRAQQPGSAPAPAAETTPVPQAPMVAKPIEPTKAMPFKLRHVVYDPKTTLMGGQSPISTTPTERESTLPKWEGTMPASQPVSATESSPLSTKNITNLPHRPVSPMEASTEQAAPSPTAASVSRRPIASRQSSNTSRRLSDSNPPPPPPKDDYKPSSQRSQPQTPTNKSFPLAAFTASPAGEVTDAGPLSPSRHEALAASVTESSPSSLRNHAAAP